MEIRYLWGLMISINLIMYYVEKDDIKKNRHILWILFFTMTNLSNIGWKILRILEESQ